MPKRSSAKRNILVAVLLVAFAGILIVAVPHLRSSTPLMPPEPAETQAKRMAPENAYVALVEALAAQPEKPAPIAAPEATLSQPQANAGLERGSLGDLLRVFRPDDDPGMLEYIVRCDPAIAKVREALARPYSLLPIRWSGIAKASPQERDTASQQEAFTQLGAMLVARSVVAARQEQGNGALALLLDAYRLALLMQSDGDTPTATDTILAQAWPRWFEVARASQEADLRAALDALDAMAKAARPMTANLEFALRMLDNSAPPSGWMRIPDRRGPRGRRDGGDNDEDAQFARKIFFTTHLRRAQRFVRENRDTVYTAVQMSYPDYAAWKPGHMNVFESSGRAWPCDPMAWVNRMVAIHARIDLACAAANIMTALELHRIVHATYPESLDVLAPEFLKAVPNDSFSGAPLHYERVNQDYILSSTGIDRHDDSADRAKKTDDIVLHEPKGESS